MEKNSRLMSKGSESGSYPCTPTAILPRSAYWHHITGNQSGMDPGSGDAAEDDLLSTRLPPDRHATLPMANTHAQSQPHIHTHSPTHYPTYPGQWHTHTERDTDIEKYTHTLTHMHAGTHYSHTETNTHTPFLYLFYSPTLHLTGDIVSGTNTGRQTILNAESRKWKQNSAKDCKEIGLPYVTAVPTMPQ